MECRQIQERISEYLEDMIQGPEKDRFDEHIRTCRTCARDLEDLRKTLKAVRSLEEVQPPPRFTRQVMEKLREEAEREQGFFRRFFGPLHTRVPVEAIAVVLLAVTLVFVFRIMRPVMEPVSRDVTPGSPHGETAGKAIRKEEARAPSALEKKAASPMGLVDEPARPPEGRAEEIAGREKPADTERATPSKSLVAEPSAANGEPPAQRAPSPEQQPGVGTRMRRAYEPAVTADEEGRKAAPPSLKRRLQAEKALREMTMTVEVFSLTPGARDIEEVVRMLGGTVLTSESTPERILLTGTLPASGVREFMEKLALIGSVKEKKLPPEPVQGIVPFRIVIVQ